MLLSDLLAFPNNLGLDIFLHSGVKPKPPNFFTAFFIIISEQKCTAAACNKTKDGNNNHHLSPWRIKPYCISHYPGKLSRELSGVHLLDNQFLNKKHSRLLPREYRRLSP